MRIVITILAAILSLPIALQAETLEELLVERGFISKSERARDRAGTPAKLYWEGGTRLEFPEEAFSLQINTLINTRYEFVDEDHDSPASNRSSFDVSKARIILTGSALNNEFQGQLESDFAFNRDARSLNAVGDTSGADRTELLDAWIKWEPCEWGGAQLGQMKPYLNRGNNAYDYALQFPDRDRISDAFTIERQPGLGFYGEFGEGRYTFGSQIFNGRSDGEGLNLGGTDTKHIGIGAFRANLLGEMNPYVEGDIDGSEELALNWGIAGGYGEAERSGGIPGAEEDLVVASTDLNLKYEGLSFHGEFYWADVDSDLGDREPYGFVGQAGYFIIPSELELALRYGYAECDDGGCMDESIAADKIQTLSIGLNYFFWRHHLKAQLAYELENLDDAAFEGTLDDLNTNRWIFQLASYF